MMLDETSWESAVISAAQTWMSLESSPHNELLRLALLRKLARRVHRAKSEGRTETVLSQLVQVEHQLERVGNALYFNPSTIRTVSSTPSTQWLSTLVPDAPSDQTKVIAPQNLPRLFLEKDRWSRPDRSWERLLIAEANRTGWIFSRLRTWIEIHRVQEFERQLETRLWPQGVILWAESGAEPWKTEGSVTFWQCEWWATLSPDWEWAHLPFSDWERMK